MLDVDGRNGGGGGGRSSSARWPDPEPPSRNDDFADLGSDAPSEAPSVRDAPGTETVAAFFPPEDR
jgi:hypothetical protein